MTVLSREKMHTAVRTSTRSAATSNSCLFVCGCNAGGAPIDEAIARAIEKCNLRTRPSKAEVTGWVERLKNEERVVTVNDVDEHGAAGVFRRVGVKNVKLRNAIVRECFGGSSILAIHIYSIPSK